MYLLGDKIIYKVPLRWREREGDREREGEREKERVRDRESEI